MPPTSALAHPLAYLYHVAMDTLPPASPANALTPLAPGYRNVIRAHLLIFWLPVLIGAGALALIFELPWREGLYALLVALAAFTIILLPSRRFERWDYALSEDRLRVVRGYLFRVDTVVPFVRVQHIDVSQGPIERMFGVSTLTIHTAGTHNSVVALPGLEPESAAQMRDAIRAQIRSDFA